MKKASLTIGIPAYNEEENIKVLLSELLKQKCNNFLLKSIIVASDGSKDNTVKNAKSIHNQLISVIENEKRRGIASMLNQIINFSKSDILVILNADISIKDPLLLEKMIEPILNGTADLTSCRFTPLKPVGVFEKTLLASINMKRYVFEKFNNGNNVYTCHGFARAFSQRLYKDIYFHASVGEDAYSYLFCKYNQYKYTYVKNTSVFYKLPHTTEDHEKQSIRYIQSIGKFKDRFGKEFINKEYGGSSLTFGLNPFYLLEGLAYSFAKFPLYTMLYLFISLMARCKAACAPVISNTWSIATSSKKLA